MAEPQNTLELCRTADRATKLRFRTGRKYEGDVRKRSALRVASVNLTVSEPAVVIIAEGILVDIFVRERKAVHRKKIELV